MRLSRFSLPVLLFALLIAGGLPFKSAACRPTSKVLVINSYHAGFVWSDLIMEGMKDAFDEADLPADLFIEYLDSKRFPDDPGGTRTEAFRRYLEEKYSSFSFDLILSSDDNALRFLLAWGEKLFPGVPVVFCGVNNFDSQLLTGRQRYTGVIEVIDPRATIDLAHRLYPDMERLVVVVDRTVSAAGNRREFEALAEDYPFPILFVPGEAAATPEQVARELAGLPEGTVVYYSDLFQGERGNYFPYPETLPMLTEACPYPVFTHSEFYIGYGVVGGVVVSGRKQGYEAGRAGARILWGRDPESMPVRRVGPNRPLLDYRALQRFGISVNNAPLEAELVGEPDGFFYRYRRFLLRIALVLLVETCLLVILFLSILHRRRVQRKLAEREENLSVTLRSIGDAVIATDAEGRVTQINPVAEDLTGWKRDEALERPLTEVFPIFSSRTGAPVESPVLQVLREGKVVGLANHTELRARDGRRLQIADSAAPIRKPDGEVVGAVMVFRDVTEEYRKEQERLEQNEGMRRLLAEREVMLREIHHRVKNNLQIISSMLRLQSFSLDIPEAAGLFLDSQNRIRSMALVHELLYRTENLASIDMRVYVERLLRQIAEAYGVSHGRVATRSEFDGLSLPVDLAIPCGLLLTELYSNSLKHAFPDERKGVVTVSLHARSAPDGPAVELCVRDDGIGLSGADLSGRSLGMQLVEALVNQLGGALEAGEGEGAAFRVLFPMPADQVQAKTPGG